MSAKKNILLFRGENTRELSSTVRTWREKFIEKHGEMNLLEIRNDNVFDGILADCLTPGFMGGTRMVIFYEQLLKTKKEQDKIAEQKASEAIDLEEVFEDKNTNNLSNDRSWIQTLEKIPETNFIIFVGNKKPVTELEEWLEENATLRDFGGVTPRDMEEYIMKHLPVTENQARAFCDKL